MTRSVREMTKNDIQSIIDYFLESSPEFLRGMGADVNKLPGKEEWSKIILGDFEKQAESKKLYYVIWQLNDIPVGHSNINDIIFGKEAYMHVHLWHPDNRNKGDGSYFIKESLIYYFKIFKLQKLFCQPYALNPAPNKTLHNIGFEFIKKYETIPGWLNFKQFVNLWVLDRNRFHNQICGNDESDASSTFGIV
jgi:RimJ/RimL family protein N-acetyltransferase